tara:strand:- start:440 stop:886 length:447 start_codon:yes stop_codon:yes gene_type:complete
MEFINLKKCKQKIIQNKYSQITLKFYYFFFGLILVFLYFPDESISTLNYFAGSIPIFGFIISYYIHDKRINFFKTITPIILVIYTRYLIYIAIFFLLFIFLNYKVFDQSFEGFSIDLIDFFAEIIIWFNILINFVSVQKNSIIFNQVE